MTKSLTKNQSTKKIIEGLHPMGRMGKAEVANAALFLALTNLHLLQDQTYWLMGDIRLNN